MLPVVTDRIVDLGMTAEPIMTDSGLVKDDKAGEQVSLEIIGEKVK